MRILHTSDWHLGARLPNGESRLDEQKLVLEEICGAAEENHADLVLVCGDIYHHYNPSAEAEILFYKTLARLSAGGERAIAIIAGNHDNPERLCAASPFFRANGILAVGGYDLPAEKEGGGIESVGANCYLIRTRGGDAMLAALPHASEGRLRATYAGFTGRESAGYRETMEHLLSLAEKNFNKTTVNLFMSHLYASGGEFDGDELTGAAIGGAEGIPLSIFPAGADYIALGHLHRKQRLSDTAAYSGSPLQYQMGSPARRCVLLGDIAPGGKISISEVPLTSGKGMVKWQAAGMEEALDMCRGDKDRGSWIMMEIAVSQPLQSSEVTALREAREGDVLAVVPVYPGTRPMETLPDIGNTRPEDLFTEFYKTKMKREPGQGVMELFTRLSAEAQTTGEDADETASS